MVALKEIMARTGLSEGDAKTYVDMAEERVRLYLNYEDEESLTRFSSAISDVAVALYNKTEAVRTAQTAFLANAGISSKSYSEGPVSISENYGNNGGLSVSQIYEEEIKSALNSIARYRRARVIKC